MKLASRRRGRGGFIQIPALFTPSCWQYSIHTVKGSVRARRLVPPHRHVCHMSDENQDLRAWLLPGRQSTQGGLGGACAVSAAGSPKHPLQFPCRRRRRATRSRRGPVAAAPATTPLLHCRSSSRNRPTAPSHRPAAAATACAARSCTPTVPRHATHRRVHRTRPAGCVRLAWLGPGCQHTSAHIELTEQATNQCGWATGLETRKAT